MPFDPDNPPAKIKSLPAKNQRQWVEIFNSCWKKHHDDAKCHAMAWGVAKKAHVAAVPVETYVEDVVDNFESADMSLTNADYDLRDAARLLAEMARAHGMGRDVLHEIARLRSELNSISMELRSQGSKVQPMEERVTKLFSSSYLIDVYDEEDEVEKPTGTCCSNHSHSELPTASKLGV